MLTTAPTTDRATRWGFIPAPKTSPTYGDCSRKEVSGHLTFSWHGPSEAPSLACSRPGIRDTSSAWSSSIQIPRTTEGWAHLSFRTTFGNDRWARENAEKLDLDATLDLVRTESTPGSFDDKPLVILTPRVPDSGDIGQGGSQGLPGPRVKELDSLYLRLEQAMTDLSSDSRLILVDDTGHCIQCDQPQVVVDAVREVTRQAMRES